MRTTYTTLLVLFLNITSFQASAQLDTLKITFPDAEKTFLENNIGLIAQKYNVQASKALIQQAKLWDNPYLATDQNLYDNTRKFFNHTDGNGEIYLVVSQVIKTAGKRGKEIELAKDQAEIQEALFNDLMRNLHYNLQLDFAQLANLNDQAKVYQNELTAGDQLITKIEHTYKTDKTKFKDYIRLKALLFGLENDKIENSRQINALETELKVLLRTKSTAFIAPVIKQSKTEMIKLDLNNLINQAKIHRADYHSSDLAFSYAKHNLEYQKALAIPNITVGVDYDHTNSYSKDYFGMQVGFQLPFFNRNQGNIRSARYAIQNKESVLKENELRLENAVVSTFQQYEISKNVLSSKHTEFNEQYDQLFKTLLHDYESGKTGLVEFVDFFDSYKDTKLKLLQQEFSLQKAIADLNYTVGTTVIKP